MTATYYYRIYNYQGGYVPYTMRVEVVGESAKSYHVKYLEFHANGTRPGTLAWVRKSHVKGMLSLTPHTVTGEVRLPYKD